MSSEKSEDEKNEKAISDCNHEVLSLVEETAEGFLANGLWMTKKEEELSKEIEKMSTEKAKNLFSDEKDRRAWVEAIKKSVEQSIQSQVRAALGTPPVEKRKKLYEQRLAEERRRRRLMNQNFDVDRTTGKPNYSYPSLNEDDDVLFYKRQQYLQKYAVRRTMRHAHANSLGNTNENTDSFDGYNGTDPLSSEFNKRFSVYTRAALENVGKSCANLNSNSVYKRSLGCEWIDRNGESHEIPGPFWPKDHLPRLSNQKHIHFIPDFVELLNTQAEHLNTASKATTTNPAHPQEWRGTCIVYERQNNRQGTTHVAPPGCPPSLTFESRFECGNLRQARRIGTYEYDLLLDCDLYTKRHMQWYYFRVQNMVTDAIYKFNIINLLKRDSLYNYGMKPLVYSEREATVRGRGWKRVGCNISYFKTTSYNNPLLCRQYVYYTLSFQMEFSHADDTCYLAHCYPYSYTDLELYLRSILDKPRTCQHVRKEVLCKTMAGNNCYVLTITSTKVPENEKLGVVVSARVHPGETNASWMMKGMLDFLTSGHHVAEKLRRKFVFKLVPMLNPDGVIVGNYRTNLAARDLNRTYRNPKKESFPTVWHLKNMLESFKKDHQVIIYCDLHGHSRKPNVFMYGCTADPKMASMSNFIEERLFPWMMSQKAPDKFSFNGCKFRVRKCKESTARVVMWRQMGITNSFTMEATFCGANFGDVEKGRHFHVGDFEEMGRHFCEVLLEYSEAKNENRSEMTQSFVELACKMTRDILRQSVGSFQPGKSAADTEKETATTKRRSHDSRPKENEDTEDNTSDTYDRSSSLSKLKNILDSQTERLKAGEDVGVELTRVKSVHIDSFNDCLKILENINLVDCFDESDSSDSDSDPDVDLGGNESSSRENSGEKKKKKKKKKKGKHWWETLSKPQVQEASSSTATEDDDANKERKIKLNFGKFVNPYVNRSNGGIPIFSQERIQERAKKKEGQEPKSSQDSQRKECLVKYEEERHNSAPVLAVSDDTELNFVTAQRRLAYYMFTSNNQQHIWGANTTHGRNKFPPGHSKQVMEVDSFKFDYPAGGGYGFAIRIPGRSPSVSQKTQAEITHGTEQLRHHGLQSFEEARSKGRKKHPSPVHNCAKELRAKEVLPGVLSTHHRRYLDDDFDETKIITSRHAIRNTERHSVLRQDLAGALEFEFLAKQRKHFARSRSEYTMSFLGANEDEFKSFSARNRTRSERPLLEPPATIPGYRNVTSPLNGRQFNESSHATHEKR